MNSEMTGTAPTTSIPLRRKRIAAGGCWPTPLQRLLLEAALLPDDRALTAWGMWKTQVDLDTLDFGSRHILPLLYRNLGRRGVTDPLLGKIKGVYRHTWFANQRLVQAVVPLLHRLQSAGVPTLALKGIALVEEYYGDRGLRPMGDADILVPGPQVRTAVRILMEDGWMPRRKGYESPPDRHLLYKNAQAHFRPDGLAVDLHWHLLPECCHPQDDDVCWSRADRMCLDTAETLCLDPSTQFLHTLLHGVKWSPVPPLRWIADAWWILRQKSLDMDWDYILAETRRRQMNLPVRHALQFLHDLLQPDLPSFVIDALAAAPVTARERLEYRHRVRYARCVTHVPVNWIRFYRLLRSRGTSRPAAVLELLERIRMEWDLSARWQVPCRMVFKGTERLLHFVRGRI